MRWSLNELYPSFASEEFQKDLVSLDEKIEDLNQWAVTALQQPGEAKGKLEAYVDKIRGLSALQLRLMAYCNLTLAVDARNEPARNHYDRLQVKSTLLTKPSVLFEGYMRDLEELDAVIKESPLLEEHRFFLEEVKRGTAYLLSEKEEVLLSKLKNTGSSAWTNLQNMLSSTLTVEVELEDGVKHMPLPAVRNLAYHKDPAVRRAGYAAEMKVYGKIEESSAAALNGIKGEVLTVSQLRGYASPLEETLLNSRMDQEILDAMFTAVKEYLPVFRKYLQRKARLLGHEGGLPFHDLFAPVGEGNLTFTYDAAMDFIMKNFYSFSTRLGDYAKTAYEKQWMDVEPRDGKRGGAFCSNLHPIGESRILSNFDGSFSNMTTLAHELGHGYHGLNLREESILNSRYPMPIAETASIFCETIVVKAALKEADTAAALSILESSVSDATQVVVDIFSRFLFESEVFARREQNPLSVSDFKNIMISAQKEAYGEGLDEERLHPYMWINKPHYYSAGLSFYNFPYTFGLLFAKGLYATYLERGESFVSEYDALLAATGKKNVRDVAAMMGVDVTQPDFFRSSLKIIEEDVERFLALTDSMV